MDEEACTIIAALREFASELTFEERQAIMGLLLAYWSWEECHGPDDVRLARQKGLAVLADPSLSPRVRRMLEG